jgi:predicted GNAT family acetyltransferase
MAIAHYPRIDRRLLMLMWHLADRWGRVTPNGIRIGPVYTPPEHRRHGYASAVTAGLSSRLLESRRFCFLYTDLANPTSNKIYEQIGYRRVCEAASIAFDQP